MRGGDGGGKDVYGLCEVVNEGKEGEGGMCRFCEVVNEGRHEGKATCKGFR